MYLKNASKLVLLAKIRRNEVNDPLRLQDAPKHPNVYLRKETES